MKGEFNFAEKREVIEIYFILVREANVQLIMQFPFLSGAFVFCCFHPQPLRLVACLDVCCECIRTLDTFHQLFMSI